MFDKLFKKKEPAAGNSVEGTSAEVTSAEGISAEGTGESQPKKSLYRKYQDVKASRAGQISDEDMLKYTGKSRGEITEWAKDREDVGGNRLAGRIGSGGTPVGGTDNWAPLGKQELKFPPKSQESKKSLDDDEYDD